MHSESAKKIVRVIRNTHLQADTVNPGKKMLPDKHYHFLELINPVKLIKTILLKTLKFITYLRYSPITRVTFIRKQHNSKPVHATVKFELSG